MIKTFSYDVEVTPNFFSICIIDLNNYLDIFKDVVDERDKPITLVKKYSVSEIKDKLKLVKKVKYFISDTDDSQLLDMISIFNRLSNNPDDKNKPIRLDFFGYNTSKYDKLMIACLLMNFSLVKNTKELITILYKTSKNIIDLQNRPEIQKNDYVLNSLKEYKLPFNDIDVMSMFALNKVGKIFDTQGETSYYGKSLKQTSINLQWYDIIEHELPKISEKDAHYYKNIDKLRGIDIDGLNMLVELWDRYIHPDWIKEIMHYNENDVFIVCELIRMNIDEVRLRYTVSNAYKINVLSSSRSDIANKLFSKFYSEFSNIPYYKWKGNRTDRTRISFKRVILPIIQFKTKPLQDLLVKMKKTVVSSASKNAFNEVITINNLDYSLATGGIHSIDKPRVLKSQTIEQRVECNTSSTGGIELSPDIIVPANNDWNNLSDDSFVYVHFDISSFYPSIMIQYGIYPEHLDKGVFIKLLSWIKDTRIEAKYSKEPIDGIPAKLMAEVLKIVINSIYGKLGYYYGDLMDILALLQVTINGQLLILMLCEELEMNGLEVFSANTDGIVVKVYKKDKLIFDDIIEKWKVYTKLDGDSEELKLYINRDINNYLSKEFNDKETLKGIFNPNMYLLDLSKGYNNPIVSKAVYNYFIYNKPVLETLYEANDILDFCKTQNVGKQFIVELTKGVNITKIQRNTRFYVSNNGVIIEKVNRFNNKHRSNLCAKYKVTVINTLDDKKIHERNINYSYYYQKAMDIINPVMLGISPNQKANRDKGTKSGKQLIKKYSNMFINLFDDVN